ncbi:unnamed protein product [Parnassius apollo]|uniref:(apollo) hypothetical protein n=1 Tax=Parnassius apollo TaxID=110799 RepID=A0A8S3X0E4_PARAO|nr:unnamed protein product [Parnassius apollo]
MKNLTTFALVAILAAHALPNRERSQGGYENSGYERSYNNFEGKNNNRGSGSSSENDCDESNGSSYSNNREKSYDKDGHYMKDNYQDRHFSAKAFAAAPDAASAQSYDYDRKDSIFN